MTTTTIMIEKMREQFLTALNDTQVSTELLKQLVHAAEQSPGVLDTHKVDSITRAIDADHVSWNPDYFSRQKLFAAHNFSKQRLEHLIQVRDVFRQRNEKGFTPNLAALTSRKNPMNSASFDFQPSAHLKQFADEGDLLAIRTALRLELNDRRLDGAELYATLAWIKDNVPGIFEAISEGTFAREIVSDQNRWTEDYYDLQVTYTKTNFSEKRFLHLIEVREHLRNTGVKSFAATRMAEPQKAFGTHSAPSTTQAPSANSSQPIPGSSQERNPAFRTALLIGGAIAAVVIFLVALGR